MPLVTIYTSEKKAKKIGNTLPKLKECIAKELTCENRIIQPKEISIQIINPLTSLSIADIYII